MTFDDDDVVPAGSRRSSYVPPADGSSDDAIDIPRIVVSGDIPQAQASTDRVPDLQRAVLDDVVTGEIPLAIPVDDDNSLKLPVRQSLTPAELTKALDPDSGLSSSEQMTLLDSQIALRASDAKVASEFLELARADGTPEAVALFETVKAVFSDVAPELAGVRITAAEPVVEAALSEPSPVDDLQAMVLDDSDNASDVEVIDEPVGQSWVLDSPAPVAAGAASPASRSHLTTVAAFSAIALTVVMLAFSGGLDPEALIAIALGGVVAASGFVLWARSRMAREGSTFREVIESLTGRSVGRLLLFVAALGGISALSTSIAAFMQGIADNEVTAGFVSRLVETVGPFPQFATVVLLYFGVVLGLLPLRALRAVVLTAIGFTVIGAGSVLGMSGFLVSASETWTIPGVESIVASAGFVIPLTLVVGGLGFAAIHTLSREHAGIRNWIWLTVGAGLGFLVAAATIVLALVSPESSHYFFANNSLVHVVSGSAVLAVVLGAVVSGAALLVTSTLVIRGALMFTVNNDRDEPSVWWKIAAVVLVGAVGAMMYVGIDESGAVAGNPEWSASIAPSGTVAAIVLSVVLGLALAHSVRSTYRSTRARRAIIGLIALVLVAVALGYSSGTGVVWSWLGFINSPLTGVGYGVLYIDAVVPLVVLVATALVSLLAMIQRRERALVSPAQD